MSPERYRLIVELFNAAWELAPKGRAAYLSDACNGDHQLRLQVEALLEADRHSQAFLHQPPHDLASEAFASRQKPCSPDEILGDYKILSPLGVGGMGEVFLAQDVQLGRKVALKLLPNEFGSEPAWLQRFQHEARAASALNHPNILTIYGFGQVGTIHYLATELVDGPTLRQILVHGPLGCSAAIDIAAQIASALEAAHEAGIIHRDIKPDNIVQRPDRLVKVLDFGVAERVGEHANIPGVITGTPQYMSPEQARGEQTDARTDLFSLGAVLYEMLSGCPAFRGATLSETIEHVLTREPPPLKPHPSKCPPALARIVARSLAKDREKRFQTAEEIRVELEAVRRDLNRKFRRPRLAVSLIAIILVAVFASYRSLQTGRPSSIRSLAVLPLEDLSRNDSQAYFSDGITEQLITNVSKVDGLRVISRSSVMQYKLSRKPLDKIARELNVDAVITGSVISSDKRVRITAQLVLAKPQQNIWAETFERSLDDLFALQSEISTTIARHVQKTLNSGAQPHPSRQAHINAEAQDLFFMGQYNSNKGTEESYFKAIDFFRKAIAKSPSYAAAYSGLAYAYMQLSSLAYHYLAPSDGMPKAKSAALKALQLDDTLSDAHTWLGYIKMTFDRDWPGAERETKRALDLNPNSADAHLLYEWYLLAQRRIDEAHREVQRAHELDPLSLRITSEYQSVNIGARRFREAIHLGEQAIQMEPEFVPAFFLNAMAYTEQGEFHNAIAAAESAIRLQNVQSNHLLLAHVLARAGEQVRAERLLAQVESTHNGRYLCPYEVGTAYVSLHRKEEAFKWLQKAMQDRVDCMIWLRTEPWMDSLLHDERYRQLVRQIGFPTNLRTQ
jgi:serine/threonine-protein kinase